MKQQKHVVAILRFNNCSSLGKSFVKNLAVLYSAFLAAIKHSGVSTCMAHRQGGRGARDEAGKEGSHCSCSCGLLVWTEGIDMAIESTKILRNI